MTDNSLDIAKSELKGLQKQVRSRLLFNTSLNALNVLLLILQAWWVAGLLHAYVIDSTVPQDLNWIVTGLLVTALLRACLHYFSQVQAYKVAQHIKDKLRTKMYDSVVQSGAALVTAEGSATIHNVLAKGIEAMDSYFADYLPTLQLAAVAPVILLCALFPADATAGWVLLGLAPLIPIVMIWVGKAAGKLNQKQWRTLARLGVQLLDRIQGIRMLKAYGRSRAEAQFIFQASENYRTETMRVLRVAFLSSLALEFFATISVALVAVIIGFKLYYAQSTYLYGMFVLLLAPEFFVALRQMGVYYHAKMDAVSAAEQMLTLQQAEQATAENFPLLQANAPVTIELKQLSHNYGEIRALQGVDLTIAAGKITAIIGESGAGKSTLLKLLMGLLNPQHGELRLNGQVLSSFNHPNWWNHVAWVGQRVAVLQATIAENVHMFATEVNLSRVQEAIAFAELDEWVATQESGIDTMLEEGGHNLSGGQMQRLALARAYYKDAEVLVFDELTAYLDSATETAILAKVALMAKGKTTLIVTHRYPSMQLADEWVVLETGQVKRHGAAANLLADEALMSQLNVDGVEDSVEHGNEGDA